MMSKRFHKVKGGEYSQQDRLFNHRRRPRPEQLMKGKKSSSLHPGEIPAVDPKVAILLGLSFPIALFVFWKVTLPFLVSTCSLIIGADFVQTVMFLKDDIMNALMLPCPNWLAADDRAFLMNSSLTSIRRVSNMNSVDFQQIVNAGEPVVITDGMKDWPGLGLLSCESLISNYPDAVYFDWQGQVSIALKDIKKRKKYQGLECAAGYMNVQTSENSRYIEDWVKKVKVPYFLSDDVYTDELLANTSHPNFNIFIGTPHTGVSPHLDETCNTFISAQFSGVKNWSLSWPIKDKDELKWSNPIIFTLYPGELLFWYVGMRHHTEVVEGCSLSFSFQITTPAPRDYFQKLLETINSLSKTDRENLFKLAHSSDFNFLNSCNIFEKNGKSYIAASLMED